MTSPFSTWSPAKWLESASGDNPTSRASDANLCVVTAIRQLEDKLHARLMIVKGHAVAQLASQKIEHGVAPLGVDTPDTPQMTIEVAVLHEGGQCPLRAIEAFVPKRESVLAKQSVRPRGQ